jgi:photosystem II stability/assembly factor-like uncharacterized protein
MNRKSYGVLLLGFLLCLTGCLQEEKQGSNPVEPTTPLLNPTTPISNATVGTQPTLAWSMATGMSVHLEVSLDSGFSLPILDDTLSSSFSTVGPLANDTAYWWRVRNASANPPGEWSQPRRFKTEAWTNLAVQTPASLAPNGAVTFPTTSTGYAASNKEQCSLGTGCVSSNKFLKTTNGGATWTALPSSAAGFTSLHFFDENRGYGANGKLMKTMDGGLTWTQESDIASWEIHFLNADTGWASDKNRTIYKTFNGGVTWSKKTIDSSASGFRTFVLLDGNTAQGIGFKYKVLRTTNGGDTWTVQTIPEAWNLNAFHFLNKNQGWIVGVDSSNSSLILHTKNGGETWSRQPCPTGQVLYSVAFFNASVGYAVGYQGTLLETRNGGETWTKQDLGTTAWLDAVLFSGKTGWILGSDKIFRTTRL